jgi:hypothetical protein
MVRLVVVYSWMAERWDMAEEAGEHGEAVGTALGKVLVRQRQVVHRDFAPLRVRPVQALLVHKNKN